MPRSARKPAGTLVVADQIARQILLLRGQRVMLSPDLASLYGVENRALIQAVSRNRKRFPEDFMFQLTREEAAILRSQIVISSAGWGGRRHIMRAFVHLRQLLATHAGLARKLAELERTYDAKFRVVFDAIRQLMEPVEEAGSRPAIGFR